MGLTRSLQTVSNFLSPIAINGLLTYLGEGGKGAVVRPWVWILLLFLSPLMGSVLFSWSVHHTGVMSLNDCTYYKLPPSYLFTTVCPTSRSPANTSD